MLERYLTKAPGPVRVDVGRKVVTIHGVRDQADLERQLRRRYGDGKLVPAGQLVRWVPAGVDDSMPVIDAGSAGVFVTDADGMIPHELPCDAPADLEADVDDEGAA